MFLREILKPRHAWGLLFTSRVIGLVKQAQATAFFSEPQIDHFVMAITSATLVEHYTLAARDWFSVEGGSSWQMTI